MQVPANRSRLMEKATVKVIYAPVNQQVFETISGADVVASALSYIDTLHLLEFEAEIILDDLETFNLPGFEPPSAALAMKLDARSAEVYERASDFEKQTLLRECFKPQLVLPEGTEFSFLSIERNPDRTGFEQAVAILRLEYVPGDMSSIEGYTLALPYADLAGMSMKKMEAAA